MAFGDVELLIRKLPDGCWVPAKNKVVAVGERRVSLRRYAWALKHGSAPRGFDVRATCGRKMCVRPSHCELHPSEKATELALGGEALDRSRGEVGAVVVGEELVPARTYRAIREHPAASLAALRTKFGLSSSTIYKIRAGLAEVAA